MSKGKSDSDHDSKNQPASPGPGDGTHTSGVPEDVTMLYMPMHVMAWSSLGTPGIPGARITVDPAMGQAFIPVFYDPSELAKHYPPGEYQYGAFRRTHPTPDKEE